MPLGALSSDRAVFHRITVRRNLPLTLGCTLVDLVESPWLRDVQTELDSLLHALLRPPFVPLLLIRPCWILPSSELPLCVVELRV